MSQIQGLVQSSVPVKPRSFKFQFQLLLPGFQIKIPGLIYSREVTEPVKSVAMSQFICSSSRSAQDVGLGCKADLKYRISSCCCSSLVFLLPWHCSAHQEPPNWQKMGIFPFFFLLLTLSCCFHVVFTPVSHQKYFSFSFPQPFYCLQGLSELLQPWCSRCSLLSIFCVYFGGFGWGLGIAGGFEFWEALGEPSAALKLWRSF